ncbi:Protein ASP-7 [Aphelenchoides avenae]|nr:Protein ASP-7 [Aphelenchus avenae]
MAFDGHATVATIVLSSAQPADASELGGVITFGERDEEHCASEWITLDSRPAWMIEVASFSLGDAAHKEPMDAVVVTTSTFIRVPQTFFDNVISELGALYDYDADTFYVDCSNVPALPDLVFRIGSASVVGNLDYKVPASDYARQVCK